MRPVILPISKTEVKYHDLEFSDFHISQPSLARNKWSRFRPEGMFMVKTAKCHWDVHVRVSTGTGIHGYGYPRVRVSSNGYPVTGIQYPVTGIQYPVTSIQYPVSSSQYQEPGASSRSQEPVAGAGCKGAMRSCADNVGAAGVL